MISTIGKIRGVRPFSKHELLQEDINATTQVRQSGILTNILVTAYSKKDFVFMFTKVNQTQKIPVR